MRRNGEEVEREERGNRMLSIFKAHFFTLACYPTLQLQFHENFPIEQ